MSRPSNCVPLLYNDDSFRIYLAEVGTLRIRISCIHRFAGNQNSTGIEEDFWDLDQDTRRAIIQQVQKKCPKRTIIV